MLNVKKITSIILIPALLFSMFFLLLTTAFAADEPLMGDIDLDGEVTVNDATEIQKYLANLQELTPTQLRNADLSGSGVTIGDVTSIQKYLAHLFSYDELANLEELKTQIAGGTLDLVELDMPQYDDGRTRTIRIWLPDNYDPEDEEGFTVLYFLDGQNIFNKYTSNNGIEWEIDETITGINEEIISYGYEPEKIIVVGIDGGDDYENEYCPTWDLNTNPNASGDKFAEFIMETVMPYVEANYNVQGRHRYNPAICGGGKAATLTFYMGFEHSDVFPRALSYSPDFSDYSIEQLLDYMNSFGEDYYKDLSTRPYFLLYSGFDDIDNREKIYASRNEIAELGMKYCGWGYAMLSTFMGSPTSGYNNDNEVVWAWMFSDNFWSIIGPSGDL